MLHKEIITVCSRSIKNTNTLRTQEVENFRVKPGCTDSDHWDLNGFRNLQFATQFIH